MIKAIKQKIRLGVFAIEDMLLFPSRNIEKKSLLLIRLDAIGDYVLFRNFIGVLKKSELYAGYKITLVGNIAWKSLAEGLDNEVISGFIWIDRKKLTNKPLYRYRKLREITAKGYEVVVYPAYSREFYFGDSLVRLVTAMEKVGYDGDVSNIRKIAKKVANALYTKLIPSKEGIEFEFYRNRDFFEGFLHEKLTLTKPFIVLKDYQLPMPLPENYVALFIGASDRYRKWPVEFFAEICEYILTSYQLDIVVCGGPGDKEEAALLLEMVNSEYRDHVIDLTGRTDLPELCCVIARSAFMLSNESSAPHIAVAVDTDVLVISNGNHFGRFTPYPPEMTDRYNVVYHPSIEKNLDDFHGLTICYGKESGLDIKEIDVEQVKTKTDGLVAKLQDDKRLKHAGGEPLQHDDKFYARDQHE